MKHSFLLLLLLPLLLPLTLKAVPAYPRPIQVRQPDGTLVTVCQLGDEPRHWTETTDGYTLLRDAAGFLTFAQLDADGRLQPSAVRFGGTSAPARELRLKPHLRALTGADLTAAQVRSAVKAPTDLSVDATFPTTGRRKLLVLLVNFADTRTTCTQQQFDRMMNERGYGGVGSFSDYYREQSYGKLDIDVTVTDWIQVPHNKALYNTDNAQNLVVEALQMVADTMDLHQFDNDGDGTLDGLAVIHQGYGQEMSADDGDIWSHSTVVYGTTVGGVRLGRYTIEPELLAIGNRQATIGVICHEFGHNLGAPDYYDTDYESSEGEFPGTGGWDLMGAGAWNGDYGTHPAGVSALQKWLYGWMELHELEGDTLVKAMPPADREPVAYRMSTTTEGDYFILENRQREGATFDAALPGHGLVVYHVNEPLLRARLQGNDLNVTHPQAVYTVCADAGVDPDARPASYGNVSSEGAPFPSPYGHTAFSDATLPSAHSGEGRMAYRSLTGIREAADGTVSFHFTHLSEPPHPVGLTARANHGRVSLSWSLPEGTEGQPVHYNVYRGTDRIARTQGLEFTDSLMPQGEVIKYRVDALWTGDRLSQAASASVMVPANRATAFTATADGSEAVLNWTANPLLSRADILDGRLLMLDDYTTEVEMANAYSPSDLATCAGSTLTHLTFCSLQGPTLMSIRLRVYEGEADGTAPTLVSERPVSEFAAAQMRTVKLTKPVTIRPGHTYWLAVNYRPRNGYVTLPLDGSRLTPQVGCLVWEEGRFIPVDIAQGNFFVQGTLSAPAEAEGTLGTLAMDALTDPSLQLSFPLAYSVYCDGTLLGHTTARQVRVGGLAPGAHTFALTSRFAGDNESTALTASCTLGTDPSGIGAAPAAEGDAALLISSARGMLTASLPATATATQRLTVHDLTGRLMGCLSLVPGSTVSLPLPAGLYVANGRKLLVP